MHRRQLLAVGMACGAAAALGCGRSGGTSKPRASQAAAAPKASEGRMPALFLAHGAPPLLDDEGWMAELAEWSSQLPRPRAVLMISAHWQARPPAIGATRTVPLVYDFYGFPKRFYEMRYAAPGAPELAARVRELLGGEVREASNRGLDHGAYVPLMGMYSAADVPVLQLSLPSLAPDELLSFGRALAPLRDEGVLLVGSGFLVHNLQVLGEVDRSASVLPSWAAEFDQFCAEAFAARDEDRLRQYAAIAPGVAMALPTHEHFAPALVALGASLPHSESVQFPITGPWMGAFSRRSIQFG